VPCPRSRSTDGAKRARSYVRISSSRHVRLGASMRMRHEHPIGREEARVSSRRGRQPLARSGSAVAGFDRRHGVARRLERRRERLPRRRRSLDAHRDQRRPVSAAADPATASAAATAANTAASKPRFDIAPPPGRGSYGHGRGRAVEAAALLRAHYRAGRHRVVRLHVSPRALRARAPDWPPPASWPAVGVVPRTRARRPHTERALRGTPPGLRRPDHRRQRGGLL
jgi:hypothetical protein